MFTEAAVVGNGRVGCAAAARLADRIPTKRAGRELALGDADLVLLCVPDRAISDVASAIEPGPWIAHTSGAVSLDAELADVYRALSNATSERVQR